MARMMQRRPLEVVAQVDLGSETENNQVHV
jgi:hypothetical protein